MQEAKMQYTIEDILNKMKKITDLLERNDY